MEKLLDICYRDLTIGDVTTGVPSCTLSKTTCETFLRDALLNRQMRVEIWAAEPRKQNVWNIIKRVSVFQHIL
jgi:DNA mismatch repair protein MSH2